MSSRPTGRPVGRPSRDYDRPPPPKQMQLKCHTCGKVHWIQVQDALYTPIDQPVQLCSKCGKKLM